MIHLIIDFQKNWIVFRKFLLLSPAKNATGVRETILKTFDSPYYFASFKSRSGCIIYYILIQKFASNSSCKRLRSSIGPVFPQNWFGLYLSRKFCSTSNLAKLYRFAGNMKIEIEKSIGNVWYKWNQKFLAGLKACLSLALTL